MSRIYEGLGKSEDITARAVRKILEQEPDQASNAGALAQAAVDPEAVSEKPAVATAGLRPKVVVPGNVLMKAVARAQDEPGGLSRRDETGGTGVPAGPESSQQNVGVYRTVSLRVAANVPVFPFDGSDPKSSEQYRILRTNLLHHPTQPRMIVVTSAGSGDGKTITASNIAGILALRSEAHVLVVDGDLRRSSLANAFGIPSGPGLSDVLRGSVRLEESIVRLEELPNLHVLPAGTPVLNPSELLDSPAWESVAKALRERFDFIVVDSTPVAAVADFDILQMTCDGVLLVVRPNHTNRKMWEKALASVSKPKFLGVAINAVGDWFLWKNPTPYYYSAPR